MNRLLPFTLPVALLTLTACSSPTQRVSPYDPYYGSGPLVYGYPSNRYPDRTYENYPYGYPDTYGTYPDGYYYDPYYEQRQRALEQKHRSTQRALEREHKSGHKELEREHAEAHREPMTKKEHKELHRDQTREHRAQHRALGGEREHAHEHLEGERRGGGYTFPRR